ncbi:UTP6, partial [Symbiodinium necroappetens]
SRTPAAAQAKQLLQEYISGIYRDVVAQNWTSETSGASPEAAKEALANSRAPGVQRWYGSFVVDGEAAEDLVVTLASCGVETSPVDECRPTGTAWCFFGANATPMGMQGKPEHVDQLAPGTITVHTQLCGRKVWKLRPYLLCPNWSGGAPLLSASCYAGRLELLCEEGDLLLIDTATWYHTTEIPALTDFSFSLAQDFSERLPGEKLQAMEAIQPFGLGKRGFLFRLWSILECVRWCFLLRLLSSCLTK